MCQEQLLQDSIVPHNCQKSQALMSWALQQTCLRLCHTSELPSQPCTSKQGASPQSSCAACILQEVLPNVSAKSRCKVNKQPQECGIKKTYGLQRNSLQVCVTGWIKECVLLLICIWGYWSETVSLPSIARRWPCEVIIIVGPSWYLFFMRSFTLTCFQRYTCSYKVTDWAW